MGSLERPSSREKWLGHQSIMLWWPKDWGGPPADETAA